MPNIFSSRVCNSNLEDPDWSIDKGGCEVKLLFALFKLNYVICNLFIWLFSSQNLSVHQISINSVLWALVLLLTASTLTARTLHVIQWSRYLTLIIQGVASGFLLFSLKNQSETSEGANTSTQQGSLPPELTNSFAKEEPFRLLVVYVVCLTFLETARLRMILMALGWTIFLGFYLNPLDKVVTVTAISGFFLLFILIFKTLALKRAKKSGQIEGLKISSKEGDIESPKKGSGSKIPSKSSMVSLDSPTQNKKSKKSTIIHAMGNKPAQPDSRSDGGLPSGFVLDEEQGTKPNSRKFFSQSLQKGAPSVNFEEPKAQIYLSNPRPKSQPKRKYHNSRGN